MALLEPYIAIMPWRVVIPRSFLISDGRYSNLEPWCEANLGPKVIREGGYQWRGPCPIVGQLAKEHDPAIKELWWFRRRDDAVLFDMVWG